MTEHKYTPGSWRFDGDAIINHKGFIVADKGNTNWEANAQLIAAAPDILEALEYLYENADLTHGDKLVAWEAIAKAKGK